MIILLCVVGFVPVALLGVSLTVNAHNTVVKNRRYDMTNSLQQACSSVSSEILFCEQMMDYFVYDQNVIDFLECSPEKKTERYEYYQEVRKTIAALRYQNLIMQSITIYSESIDQPFGEEIQPLEALHEEAWFQSRKSGQSWVFDEDHLRMMSVYKIPSYSYLESYAVVKTNLLTLFQSFEQLAIDNYGVHLEGDGEVWNFAGEKCVNDDGIYLSFARDRDRFIWVEESMDPLEMNVIYFIPKNSVHMMTWKYIVGIAIQIICCLVIILLLGRYFSNYLSAPLEMLTREIQTVDEKNIETEVSIRRGDEIGILVNSYNHMMKRIQELIQENYETKIAQKEFEMKALQAQINPHFLYNSLSMINWKAIEAQETEISHITLTLSSFYRTTLNRGKTMTSIRNALDNIRAYLELQLYMHDNDFTVHYDVDESLYEYEIPLLIFQPFVENALEHGLDIKEDGDRQIWIQVGRNQEDILIKIRDNGVGMDEDTLQNILEYNAKGYGVKNVNDRMILHYGAEYGIHIASRKGEGTEVTLRFPEKQERK